MRGVRSRRPRPTLGGGSFEDRQHPPASEAPTALATATSAALSSCGCCSLLNAGVRRSKPTTHSATAQTASAPSVPPAIVSRRCLRTGWVAASPVALVIVPLVVVVHPFGQPRLLRELHA